MKKISKLDPRGWGENSPPKSGNYTNSDLHQFEGIDFMTTKQL